MDLSDRLVLVMIRGRHRSGVVIGWTDDDDVSKLTKVMVVFDAFPYENLV